MVSGRDLNNFQYNFEHPNWLANLFLEKHYFCLRAPRFFNKYCHDFVIIVLFYNYRGFLEDYMHSNVVVAFYDPFPKLFPIALLVIQDGRKGFDWLKFGNLFFRTMGWNETKLTKYR